VNSATADTLASPSEADGDRLRALWREIRQAAFTLPVAMTVSQWADAHRIVPSYSAEPGAWVTDKTPYLREIMDSFNEPAVNRVVFMKCSRIGATEAGINVIGYYIDQDPSPIFIVQPTVEDAKDFSKEQLTPSIEETDVLRQRVAPSSSRSSGNTIQSKSFAGGALFLVGANSPRGFRRRTARVIILEEVDGYPPSAGTEGDQVKLAERRATTFQHRRKIYINSSPTLKGQSKIDDEYAASDQRKYFVPCPHCAHTQVLRFPQLKWEDGKPHTAAYCCEGCACLIEEREKFRMIERGTWVATNPGPATRGYHLSALYSPWVTWAELVEEWLAAQSDVEKLQVFINTALGEVWEDRGGGMDDQAMYANRRESYNAAVPLAVGVLTAGVDVQHDRIEVIVRGWAHAEESYLIERAVLMGDTTSDAVWQDLDRLLLTKRYSHESGATIGITASCVDAGDQQERVLKFCTPRYRRRVFAVKGGSNPTAPFIPKRASRNNKYRCPLFILGVNQGKGLIYGRLKIVGKDDQPCAYRYHFNNEHADRDYFEQLTAEKAERKYIGRIWTTVYTCPAHRRNEVLDAELYALAALYLSNVPREQLASFARAVAAKAPKEGETPPPVTTTPNQPAPRTDDDEPPAPPPPAAPPPTHPVAPRRPPPRPSGWVNKWRR
jgi:phage terminase large subunit GpA-like protein